MQNPSTDVVDFVCIACNTATSMFIMRWETVGIPFHVRVKATEKLCLFIKVHLSTPTRTSWYGILTCAKRTAKINIRAFAHILKPYHLAYHALSLKAAEREKSYNYSLDDVE